jgi:serine protease Do
VSRDEHSDLAVIKIEADNLVPAEYGNLSNVKVGQFALAMGNPFGTAKDGDMSLSYGIVSALGKSLQELEDHGNKYYGNLIQTTADINPGNSGGPLLNLRGEVIGINTAIASESGGNEGVAFAIPINMVKLVAEQLIKYGKLDRGYLGVKLDSTFSSSRAAELGLSHLRGTRISNVTTGSPADRAHLQIDDVILSFNGVPIIDDNHLVNTVGLTGVGKQVPVVVFRDGAPLTLQVQVSAWSQP